MSGECDICGEVGHLEEDCSEQEPTYTGHVLQFFKDKTKDLESKLARIEDGYNRAVKKSEYFVDNIRKVFPRYPAIADTCQLIIKDFNDYVGKEFEQEDSEVTTEDTIKREA